MPNKQRWEWGVRFQNGQVEVFKTKREAKAYMIKGDRLVRRFVGRWKDAH